MGLWLHLINWINIPKIKRLEIVTLELTQSYPKLLCGDPCIQINDICTYLV